jgi:hypothetical protein
MRVFISWSGSTSQKLAYLLNDWMPQVINAIEPFLSSEDIAKGTRGLDVIAHELEASDCGLVCVTHQNFSAPWINFEAGALSKQVTRARVIPVLFDLPFTQMTGPLTQFQHVVTKEADLRQLMRDLNSFADNSLADGQLERALDKWMPDLMKGIDEIRRTRTVPTTPDRSVPDLLEEVLQVVRGLESEITRRPTSNRSAPHSKPTPSALVNTFRSELRKVPGSFSVRHRKSHGDLCVTVRSGALSHETRDRLVDLAAASDMRVSFFEAGSETPRRGQPFRQTGAEDS